MKKKLPAIILIFIFLFGLAILIYPSLSAYINSQRQSRAVGRYSEEMRDLSKEKIVEIWKNAQEYNRKLISPQDTFKDKQEAEDAYKASLSFNSNEVMAYIEIPKIKLKLPIYHGTGEDVLQIGVGHLEGYSLPVGGESSHCVLSGHRGLPSSELFTHLDKLELEDIFTLNVLNEVLTYQIDKITVVEPHEIQDLSIAAGKDYVTLITCTPYGVNTHRLLIRGTRIETPSNSIPVAADAELINQIRAIAIISAPILPLILAFLIIRLTQFRRKNLTKIKHKGGKVKL